MENSKRVLILGVVEDLVTNFLYYDRKEDEDLPTGIIEQSLENGEITIEEIVKAFEDKIRDACK